MVPSFEQTVKELRSGEARAALHHSGNSGSSAASGSLPGVGFRFFAPIVDLLGSRHRSRDGVQRDRVRFIPYLSIFAILNRGLPFARRNPLKDCESSPEQSPALLGPPVSCPRLSRIPPVPGQLLSERP